MNRSGLLILGASIQLAAFPGGSVAAPAATDAASAPAVRLVQSLPRPPREPRSIVIPALQWQQRLAEIDQLLKLGNASRAQLLLTLLEKEGAPLPETLSRWLALAQLREDHAEAVRLCREGLTTQPGNPRLLRELGRSLIALGRLDEASAVLDSFVSVLPDARSGEVVVVDIWLAARLPAQALARCDAARARTGDGRVLARQRAVSLLGLQRLEEAADELKGEARVNSVNLPLLRSDLLAAALPAAAARRVAQRLEAADASGPPPAGALILATSLHLQAGEARAAIDAALPLVEDRAAGPVLLQLAAALTQEGPLLTEPAARAATSSFLIEVLARFAVSSTASPAQRPRVLELLATACEDALEAGLLDSDPIAAVARLEEVLDLVRAGIPSSPHLYSARIRLARYTRDVLRRPSEAARVMERLLGDPDLPLPGVPLARLTLGECYLAAGDTSRGRIALTQLAHSRQERVAAGSAHYLLAQLDLVEGHHETARDRLATIAMDNPMADYANDALGLGLAIAEELENQTGGQAQLDLYARALYHRLLVQPDSQRVALERYVAAASQSADLRKPQHLLEKGRYELALLCRQQGRGEEALALCDRLVLDHPSGRYPADALVLKADILAAGGNTAAAREALERLLVQYPDYLFADDVRDRVRLLP